MIRRIVSNIIILALLAGWGWSAWQAHELRAQVQALQTENRTIRAQRERGASRHPSMDAGASWVDRADAHIARAGDALSRADIARAQQELALGTQDMQRAVRAPAEQTQTAILRARSQAADVDTRLKKLHAQMQQLSAATAPQIGLLRAQAKTIQAQAHALWQARHP